MSVKEIASTSTLNLLGNATRVGLSFVTAAAASRLLGSSDFGLVNLIFSYTVFLHYILTLGFDNSLAYFVPRYASEGKLHLAQQALRTGVKYAVIGTVAVTSVAAIGLPGFLKAKGLSAIYWPTMIFIAQTGLWAIAHILVGYMRGLKIFAPAIVKDQLLFPIAQFVFLILFVKFMKGVEAYTYAYTVGTILSLAYAVWALQKAPKATSTELADKALKREWIAFSFPLGMMTALETLVTWASVMAAGWYLTSSDVGHFSVCMRATLFVQFLFLALAPIFSPYMAELIKKGDRKEFKELYQVVTYWATKWGLFFAFALAVSAQDLLAVFGREYTDAALILILCLPGSFFEACLGSVKMSLVMAGHNRLNVWNFLFAIGLNVILSVILTPKYGLPGAAAAQSIALIALNMLRAFQFYYYVGLWPLNLRYLRNSIIIAVFLAACAVLINELPAGRTIKLSLAAIILTLGFIRAFWKDRAIFLVHFSKRRSATPPPTEDALPPLNEA